MLLSIRTRTLLLVLAVLSVSLTLITYMSYRDARHEVKELFDAYLAHAARLVEGMVGQNPSPETLASQQEALDAVSRSVPKAGGPGHPYESKLAFEMLDALGQPLLRSASMPPELFELLLVQLHSDGDIPQAGRTGTLSALSPWLVGYHRLDLDDGSWRVFIRQSRRAPHWVMVAEREDVRGELAAKIAQRSLLPDLVGLPLLALLVWLAIGWGLRPLERMVGLIKARNPCNLAPLVLAPLPRELEPVAAALNRLLMQVTQLLEREKQLLAAAAHELRTPLTVLRIHAQNALEAPDPVDRAEALRQLGPGVERATRVVGQLLALARLGPAAVQLNKARLDLAAFLRDELAELAPLALDKQQELTLDTAGACGFELLADAPSMAILVQNLVSNAVQYTPEGGRIRLCLESLPGSLLLRVQDSGPGVPEAMRERVFDRFFRLGNGQGAGLGLAIVRRVVELHGGEIVLDESPLGGLEVDVRLPR